MRHGALQDVRECAYLAGCAQRFHKRGPKEAPAPTSDGVKEMLDRIG